MALYLRVIQLFQELLLKRGKPPIDKGIMGFNRPETMAVEKRKLIWLAGLVHEITNHVETNSLNHPKHLRYLNSRLERLENLVRDISPRRPRSDEIMD